MTGSFSCQFEVDYVSWTGEAMLELKPRDRGRGLLLGQFF
jgi:hypothetical protein